MGDVKDSLKVKESKAPKRRRKLGEVLLEAGLLTQDQLTKALEDCARSGQRLGEYLVDQAIVSERDIASRLSHQLGYLFVDLTKETLNPGPRSPRSKAWKKRPGRRPSSGSAICS